MHIARLYIYLYIHNMSLHYIYITLHYITYTHHIFIHIHIIYSFRIIYIYIFYASPISSHRFLGSLRSRPGLPDETRREGGEGHHQQQQRHGPVTGQTKGVGHRQDACHREEPSMSGGRFLVGKICMYIYILMMIDLGWVRCVLYKWLGMMYVLTK